MMPGHDQLNAAITARPIRKNAPRNPAHGLPPAVLPDSAVRPSRTRMPGHHQLNAAITARPIRKSPPLRPPQRAASGPCRREGAAIVGGADGATAIGAGAGAGGIALAG